MTKVICPVCGSEIAISEHTHTVSNAVVIGKDSNLGTIELPVEKIREQDEADDDDIYVNVFRSMNIISELRKSGKDVSGLTIDNKTGKLCMVTETSQNADDFNSCMNSITKDGIIANSRLHRRWVLAQMCSALSGRYSFSTWLRWKGYEYQWSMTYNEIVALAEMEKHGDDETLKWRSLWFNKNIVTAMAIDYYHKLSKFVDDMKVHGKYQGDEYKRIRGVDFLLADIYPDVLEPIENSLSSFEKCTTFRELQEAMWKFDHDVYDGLVWDTTRNTSHHKFGRIHLKSNTPFCPEWVNAYKGSGAFYSLQNLINFHDCEVVLSGHILNRDESWEYVKERALMDSKHNDGYKMLGLLKDVIMINHFDFDKRMEEIGANK